MEYALVSKFCPRRACAGWAASEFSKNSQMRGGNRPPSACNDPQYQEGTRSFFFAARHRRGLLRVLVCLRDGGGEGPVHATNRKVNGGRESPALPPTKCCATRDAKKCGLRAWHVSYVYAIMFLLVYSFWLTPCPVASFAEVLPLCPGCASFFLGGWGLVKAHEGRGARGEVAGLPRAAQCRINKNASRRTVSSSCVVPTWGQVRFRV